MQFLDLHFRPAGVRVAGDIGERFLEDAEKGLYSSYLSVSEKAGIKIAEQDYLAALSEIATLRGAVDGFFDTVMVMAEDENLRNAYLAFVRLWGAEAVDVLQRALDNSKDGL